MINKKFNVGERLLFVVAWTPKATVQAVLGGLIYDWAKSEIPEDSPVRDDYIKYGNKILTTSVIAILLTAPIGAILTENLGKKWLHKTEKSETIEEINNKILPIVIDENSNNGRRQFASSSNLKGSSSKDISYKLESSKNKEEDEDDIKNISNSKAELRAPSIQPILHDQLEGVDQQDQECKSVDLQSPENMT